MFLISSCSCLCPIHWSQVLSQEWRCIWRSTNRRRSSYIWVINNFIAYSGVAYIRGLMVSNTQQFDIQHNTDMITSYNTYHININNTKLFNKINQTINSSLPRQNDHHFTDGIFKCIFMNEKFCILIWISLKFIQRVQLTISQHWFW